MKINEIFFSVQGESTFIGVPMLFIRTYGCNLKCSYCDTVYARGDLPESKGIAMGAKEAVMLEPERYDPEKRKQIAIEQNLGKGETAEIVVDIPSDELPYDEMTPDEIIECIKPDLAGLDKHLAFISITGGEPLIQPHHELKELCMKLSTLLNSRVVITIETNGTISIPWSLPYVFWIADIKTPSSGIKMSDEKIAELIRTLEQTDEIKFVIGGVHDYNWSVDILNRHIPSAMIEARGVLFSPVVTKEFPNWPRELAELITKDKLPVRFQLQLHKVIWPDVERGV